VGICCQSSTNLGPAKLCSCVIFRIIWLFLIILQILHNFAFCVGIAQLWCYLNIMKKRKVLENSNHFRSWLQIFSVNILLQISDLLLLPASVTSVFACALLNSTSQQCCHDMSVKTQYNPNLFAVFRLQWKLHNISFLLA